MRSPGGAGPPSSGVEARPAPPPEEPEPSPLERELIGRGVTAATARELARAYPAGRIAAQVERADWLREKCPKKIADPGAYLVDAIRHDYAAPAGFVSRAERDRRRAAEEDRRRAEAEAHRRRQEEAARERDRQTLVESYLKLLDPEATARLDAEAWERASPEARATHGRLHPKLRGLAPPPPPRGPRPGPAEPPPAPDA